MRFVDCSRQAVLRQLCRVQRRLPVPGLISRLFQRGIAFGEPRRELGILADKKIERGL